MPTESTRRELADFLRSRRRLVAPTQVGLPEGERRRVTGLRREEVASLAGVSSTWYAYLEQARDVTPSPALLDRLADILQLDEDERRYIRVLAHGGGTHTALLGGARPGGSLAADVVRSCAEVDHPVYAIDRYTDVLARNDAADRWYGGFGGGERPNQLRWMVADPAARRVLVDWGYEVADVVARWRSGTAVWGRDERVEAMAAELSSASPEFEEAWGNLQVSEHRSRIRLLRHPELGTAGFRLVVVRAPEFDATIVVFHLPAEPEVGEDPAQHGRISAPA